MKPDQEMTVDAAAEATAGKGSKEKELLVPGVNDTPAGETRPVELTGREWLSLFHSMEDPVLILSPDHTVRQANRAFCQFAGLPASRIIGRKCHDLVHGSAVPASGCPISGSVPANGRTEAEVFDENRRVWLNVSVEPVLQPSGDCTSIIHTLKNITRQKQAEDEIRLDETRLRRLLAILQHPAASLKELMDYLLDEVVNISSSQFGYIYYYHEDRQEFVLHAWSSGVMDSCAIPHPPTTYQLSKTGIWGEPVRQRRPLIVNDFQAPHPLRKGYPEGHAPLFRFMTVPVFDEGQIVAVAGVANKPSGYTEKDVQQLTLLMESVWKIVQRRRAEEQLKQTLVELQRLRDQLQQENVYLRQKVKSLHGPSRIVGESPAVQRALEQARQVAAAPSTVLLLGETGTGKELFASAIHELSPRRQLPMVRVNCAAIPAPLIESELFGREKGAYTGALSKQAGRFEIAHGSTLFLDEIGDLPMEVQVKLLRVLQEKQIERLGSPKPVPVDVRIITATHQNLEEAVREGRFRQDLYYRLNVFPIRIPPLRERREDIPLLVWAFVEEFGKTMGKHIESIHQPGLDALLRYPWPGNIRELRNVIERAMIVSSGPRLLIEAPGLQSGQETTGLPMREAERAHLQRVLQMTGWRIRGKNGAAELLDLKPSTLESRLVKLGLRRPAENR